jgi:hypothetical protein
VKANSTVKQQLDGLQATAQLGSKPARAGAQAETAAARAATPQYQMQQLQQCLAGCYTAAQCVVLPSKVLLRLVVSAAEEKRQSNVAAQSAETAAAAGT